MTDITLTQEETEKLFNCHYHNSAWPHVELQGDERLWHKGGCRVAWLSHSDINPMMRDQFPDGCFVAFSDGGHWYVTLPPEDFPLFLKAVQIISQTGKEFFLEEQLCLREPVRTVRLPGMKGKSSAAVKCKKTPDLFLDLDNLDLGDLNL